MPKEHADQDLLIMAAGGLLIRGAAGAQEILLVKRTRYPNEGWTLPKGKLDKCETFPHAALREVEEETGCSAELGEFAGLFHYQVKGVPKIVLFWRMTLIKQGPIIDDSEVSEVKWMPIADALRHLSYPAEKDLLAGL